MHISFPLACRGAPQYWRSVWVHHRHVRTQGPGVSNILPQGDPLGGWVAFLKHVVFANWDYYPEVGCENNVLWAMCRCWGGMKLFSGTTSKGWLNPVTCNGWCVWNWNATHLLHSNMWKMFAPCHLSFLCPKKCPSKPASPTSWMVED